MATAKISTQQRIFQALDSAWQTYQDTLAAQADKSTVTIACSGGLDSMVLLHAAHLWSQNPGNPNVQAFHVNHQLSPNAGDWQRHTKQFCQQYKVPLTAVKVEVSSSNRQSLEAQARVARYGAFASQLSDNSLILLAHHMDDQVETLLIRLFRGSGPDGLAAMRVFSQRDIQGKSLSFARPLLSLPKTALADYANEYQLEWVEDESNQDPSFDRNRIRHELWPQIQVLWPSRWPGFRKAIARSADLAAQQQQSMDYLLKEKLEQAQHSVDILSREQLKQLPECVRVDVLRFWLRERGVSLPSSAIMQTILSALESEQDRSALVQWGGHELRVYADKLYCLAVSYQPLAYELSVSESVVCSVQNAVGELRKLVLKQTSSGWTIQVSGLTAIMNVPTSDRFGSDYLMIRNVNRNDRFKAYANRPERSMTYWFKEWQIPPWHRQSFAGIYQGDSLLAVADGDRLTVNVETVD